MSGPSELQSERFVADDAVSANELYQQNGWTDGLPIVPPTAERVTEFLAIAGLAADDVVGVEPVRGMAIVAEKVAINAVMAGCLPQYLPVVTATIAAMCDETYLWHGSSASTGGSTPLIIVNGPIRQQIGMNATDSVLGNSNRANATIGRAVRLLMINLLGCVPGEMDRSTIGHPGKWTYCIAEDEDGSPWTPLAQERGIAAGASAVTVLAAEAPRQILNEWTHHPEEICETIAAEIRGNMLTYSIWPGNYALIIPKQLRDIMVAAGWQKRDIREFIHRRARVHRRDWRTAGKGILADRGSDHQEFTALRSPDDLLVVAAGGPAGGFAAVIPPWLGNRGYAVTKEIRG